MAGTGGYNSTLGGSGESETCIGKLIRKLNDMSKKPKIEDDLSGVLNEFMVKLNDNQTYLSNGIFNTNFAEAALLLQSAAGLYGKKVDGLWDYILDFQHRMLKYDEKKAKASEIEKLEERLNRNKRKKRKLDINPEETSKPEKSHFLQELDGVRKQRDANNNGMINVRAEAWDNENNDPLNAEGGSLFDDPNKDKTEGEIARDEREVARAENAIGRDGSPTENLTAMPLAKEKDERASVDIEEEIRNSVDLCSEKFRKIVSMHRDKYWEVLEPIVIKLPGDFEDDEELINVHSLDITNSFLNLKYDLDLLHKLGGGCKVGFSKISYSKSFLKYLEHENMGYEDIKKNLVKMSEFLAFHNRYTTQYNLLTCGDIKVIQKEFFRSSSELSVKLFRLREQTLNAELNQALDKDADSADKEVESFRNGVGGVEVEKGGVEKDGVEKEGVEENCVEKDGVEKDGVEIDGVEKDGVEKDGVEKDVEKDGVEKDGVEKDGVEKDGVEKDGVEKDGVETDGVEKDGVEKEGAEKDVSGNETTLNMSTESEKTNDNTMNNSIESEQNNTNIELDGSQTEVNSQTDENVTNMDHNYTPLKRTTASDSGFFETSLLSERELDEGFGDDGDMMPFTNLQLISSTPKQPKEKLSRKERPQADEDEPRLKRRKLDVSLKGKSAFLKSFEKFYSKNYHPECGEGELPSPEFSDSDSDDDRDEVGFEPSSSGLSAEFCLQDHSYGKCPDVTEKTNGDQNGGSQDSGIQDLGTQDSGIQDSGLQNSGLQDSSMQDLGIQDSCIQDSGVQNSGVQDSGIQDSGVQDSGIQDSSTQDSSIQDSNLQDSVMQDSTNTNPELNSPSLDSSENDKATSQNGGKDSGNASTDDATEDRDGDDTLETADDDIDLDDDAPFVPQARNLSGAETAFNDILRSSNEKKQKYNEWKSFICNKLKDAEGPADFDIHQYGSDIIESFGESKEMTFHQFAEGKTSSQVTKYFVASLQLANTYNIEFSDVPTDVLSNDHLKFKLLSTERHHEHLDEYVAPSEESFSEKMRRVQAMKKNPGSTGQNSGFGNSIGNTIGNASLENSSTGNTMHFSTLQKKYANERKKKKNYKVVNRTVVSPNASKPSVLNYQVSFPSSSTSKRLSSTFESSPAFESSSINFESSSINFESSSMNFESSSHSKRKRRKLGFYDED